MNNKLISICLAMVITIATAQAAEMLMIEQANETAQTNPNPRQYDGSSNYGNAKEASSSQSANYNAQASSSKNNNQGSGSGSGYNNNGGGSSPNYVRQNSTACKEQQGSPIIAKCTITAPKNSIVNGTLMMTQADADSLVMLTGTLSGVVPAGNYGFDVHESGDFSDGCTSAGEHYRPDNTTHGAPTDPEYKRQVMVFSSVVADTSGNLVFNQNMNDIFSMFGWKSIIGRSVVVHAAAMDNMGRGNNNDSHAAGHADERLGCCVVAYARGAS